MLGRLIGAALLLACSAAWAGPWEELVDDAYAHTQARQKLLESEFGLSKHERWDLDQDSREIVFSNQGKPAVVAKFQFVGSYSRTSKTWLWSWGNKSMDAALTSRMAEVREYGRKHGFRKLTDRLWAAEEVDGWEMTAVANYLLKGKGVYRAPFDTGYSFIVFTEIRAAGR